MRVIVTGSRGKVGSAAVSALTAAGHDVRGIDIGAADYDCSTPYVQADVTSAADMFAVIRDVDAVVHAAGIPEPTKNPAHTVFATNTLGTFNVVEACVAAGVRRLINISSDSVPGYTWSNGAIMPTRYPIDETHPNRPIDPYALSKLFGEQLCDAACRRTSISAVSIRPTWVITPDTYDATLRPLVEDPTMPSAVFWSYIDVRDLADLIVSAVEHDEVGHEVVIAAAPDNIGGRDIRDAVESMYPDVVIDRVERPDAGGYSIDKAQRLFDWKPTRSWRDY